MTEPKKTPTDVTELFSRDPLEYTKESMALVIEEMRKKRHLFNANPSAGIGKKSSPPKQTAKQAQAAQLNLDIKL